MTTQTGIMEKYVTLSHGQTRYFEAGEGDPTILIHGAGFLSGADNWLPVLPALATNLRVIALDCLNWGPGDVFDQELSFAYLVDHIREFMDVLGLEEVNLVGHSMGGWIATLFAYESPDRVNKLILVAAGGTATRPLQNMVEFKVPTEEQIRTQLSARLKDLPDGFTPERVMDAYLDKARDPRQGEAFAKVMRHMTNPMTRQRYNTLRRLPRISVPTLILWGTNDNVNNIEMGRQLEEGIEGSRLVVFEGAGHGLPQERPQEFTREVLDFLD
jgi:pimeloyl-ACP methyl ester carboxylesterase